MRRFTTRARLWQGAPSRSTLMDVCLDGRR